MYKYMQKCAYEFLLAALSNKDLYSQIQHIYDEFARLKIPIMAR